MPAMQYRLSDVHADPPADDLAFAQLRQQVAYRVDGNREADPDVALALTVADDGGVDADDFAAHVEERAAGVAGIDRRVGLNEVLKAFGVQPAEIGRAHV